jgi:PAS domain S-box-containing protein
MHLELTLYVLPLIAATALAALLGLYAWSHRSAPGATALAVLMLAVSLWSLAYALELTATTPEAKVLWAKVQYLGIAPIPLAWLALALGYTGRGELPALRRAGRFGRGLLYGLGAFPLGTVLLAWTNEFHGLLWRRISFEQHSRVPALQVDHGPWFWIHSIYAYVLLLAGTVMLASFFWRARTLYRKQAAVLVLGSLAPWAGNALYLSGHSPVPGLDPTPFAFTLTGLVLLWGVSQYGLLDLVPIARDAVLEAMHDGVVVLDLQNRIVDLNPAALRLLGRPAAELIGRPAGQAHSGLAAALARLSADTQDSEGARVEVAWPLDGAEHFLELRVSPWRHRDGRLAGRLLILHDITDRTHAEQERARRLQEQAARAEAEAAQRRLATLAEVSRALSASIDAPTMLERVAGLCVPGLGDLCIIDLVEDAGCIRRAAAAHADPARATLLEQLRRAPPVLSEEPALAETLRTGIPRHVSSLLPAAAASPGRNLAYAELLRALAPGPAMIAPLTARGRVLGAITIASGIANRAYTAADLALLEDLAGRIGLAIENARLYREAQQALQARDDFLASIAHDLRNPLATIKGYAQMLQMRISRLDLPDAERMAEMLRRIDATVARMTGLLTELIDLSRLHTGQPLELQREPTDLVALARHLVAEYQQTAPAHRLHLETAVPELIGWWDRPRLERVLSNLLSNAIKYSPDGGEITVTIARRSKDGMEWAVVEVRDRGMGIPAEDLPHIFERFYRGRNVAAKISGTGIGLASARGIVEQHGGTITVQSREGEGSTFTIYLPITSKPAGT